MFKNLQKGFTLLELLIVITILAILTLVVVLFINPVEMLKKARDVQRMSDLAVLRTAIVLYMQDKPNNTLGNSTICATTLSGAGSAANATSTYQWMSMPSGTLGYASSSSANYTKNDGTGWVPVNFAGVASSSSPPIAKLPIDPTNTFTTSSATSTALYYRYACKTGIIDGGNNTFEIDATLESDAYTVEDPKASKDGGNSTYRYEVGTNLNILPAYVLP